MKSLIDLFEEYEDAVNAHYSYWARTCDYQRGLDRLLEAKKSLVKALEEADEKLSSTPDSS